MTPGQAWWAQRHRETAEDFSWLRDRIEHNAETLETGRRGGVRAALSGEAVMAALAAEVEADRSRRIAAVLLAGLWGL